MLGVTVEAPGFSRANSSSKGAGRPGVNNRYLPSLCLCGELFRRCGHALEVRQHRFPEQFGLTLALLAP
jgi:hypothetical protein